ncbi:Zn-dependent oxidoreductase [Halorussus halophilus]|uniref:Zn-dependent oxidoreductase n=1 Tax=Halorussus halophilus TaxID=2650975 RepID=UPI00130175E5|nr:Zn-dependent oxidoreductase [Halorussus halophilus]
MSQKDSSREVVCTLTEEQERERSKEVQSRLVSHYLGFEETEDGLAVRFDGTDESLLAVAQFTSSELQCCAFAEYEITVTPPYEETVLTITGPEGTRQLFRDGLVDRLDAESA